MNEEKLIQDYVNAVSSDYTQIGDVNFILVFITSDGKIHHNIGNELCFLIDYYDQDKLTPEQALHYELTKNNANIGAIYKREKDDFYIIAKEGFDNAIKIHSN